jgi:Saxitoxin biosynthesis operon protein SxtJ
MSILKEIKEISSTKKDCRSFGLLVGGVIVVIGLFLLWKTRPSAPWFLGVGGGLMLFGLVAPLLLKPLQKIWMTFAVLMGFVMTRLILVILFYVVMTLIGRVARIFGAKFLALRPDRSLPSYWQKRPDTPFVAEQAEKQF